jgi:hypothetical protein
MTEHEHHRWGALLKYIEAFATAYRYDRYPRNSKVGKKFERFLNATHQLRQELNLEYSWAATEHLRPRYPEDYRDPTAGRRAEAVWAKAHSAALTSNVYHDEKLLALWRQILDLENIGSQFGRLMLKNFYPDPDERTCYLEAVRELFRETVEDLLVAAQGQMQRLPWKAPDVLALAPPAMPLPEVRTRVDRHADLRSAMHENPDQPQAEFVKQFHVHPITVRRCRQMLEEAGEIPVLAHRLKRPVIEPQAEAAD